MLSYIVCALCQLCDKKDKFFVVFPQSLFLRFSCVLCLLFSYVKAFICFCRDEEEADIDSETNNSRYEEPLSSRSREELGGGHAMRKPAIASRSRGPKRPDKPLYMPRAARDRLSLQNSHGPSDHELPSPVSTSNSCMSSSDSCYCPETTENTKTTSRQERLPSVTDAIPNHVGDIAEVCPQGLHEAEPSVCYETTSCFADMTLEDDENDEEDLGSVSFRTLTEEVSLCMVLMAG